MSDLEELLTTAFTDLNWRVVDASTAVHDDTDDRTIVRQYHPRVRDARTAKLHRYRLDFAHPPTKTGLEVDGYNRIMSIGGKRYKNGVGGHVTWSGFHADRERDRNLLLAGWRIMRCGPGDLRSYGDALEIARQFILLIIGIKSGKLT